MKIKILILVSISLIAFLLTGCSNKNMDLFTNYDKELGRGLYTKINYNHIGLGYLFLIKAESEEIELMHPLFPNDIDKSGNIREPKVITELLYKHTVYSILGKNKKLRNTTIVKYDDMYHTCFSNSSTKDSFGPIYAEIDREDNKFVSILYIIYHKELMDKPDKNGYRLPINYDYPIPSSVKLKPESLKDAVGYSKAYILTGSKAQEKALCLNKK